MNKRQFFSHLPVVPSTRMTLFLLVILLFLPSLWADSCHSDRNKDHRPRVSCMGMSLSSVPASIEPSTEVLVLSQNLFTSLNWGAYVGFPGIHELDLSQNHISVLEGSGLFLCLFLPPVPFIFRCTFAQARTIKTISSIMIHVFLCFHLRHCPC